MTHSQVTPDTEVGKNEADPAKEVAGEEGNTSAS